MAVDKRCAETGLGVRNFSGRPMGWDSYSKTLGGKALVGLRSTDQPCLPMVGPRLDSDNVDLLGDSAGPFGIHGEGIVTHICDQPHKTCPPYQGRDGGLL